MLPPTDVSHVLGARRPKVKHLNHALGRERVQHVAGVVHADRQKSHAVVDEPESVAKGRREKDTVVSRPHLSMSPEEARHEARHEGPAALVYVT